MQEYKTYPIDFKPLANPKAIVQKDDVRFTLLTDRLIRCEYDPSRSFQNQPSQAFWYREQPCPKFSTQETDTELKIETEFLHLTYKLSPAGFTQQSLSIQLKQSDVIWKYGDRDHANLLGTARTLDEANGDIRLETGLLSKSGWAVIDDSQSLIFDEKGWISTRDSQTGKAPESIDLYFFGYGHAYLDCLKDYSKITGKVPLLPRWVLGNWWSRYWKYSDTDLKTLMQEFKDHQVPLSVCIVDMDWHITDTGNSSSGWTGYTWNDQYFPHPKEFVDWLHSQGLRTALNLHPAEGIHPHEKDYVEIAEKMGIDPNTQTPVNFDIADPAVAQQYFEILHHRKEENEGIDFWWMDWQQGVRVTNSKNPDSKYIDPLWWLNHLHFYDLQRTGKSRGFIFSRWGGYGNHRYPIGFSGDTVISWDSLAFQPYFTATASNVAYSWWSHDIGGHMGGVEDDELYVRWVQFGVFSPIFRLHCTSNPYHERRPWARGKDNADAAEKFMKLRHQLVPYIYTMSWRNYSQDIPFIWPMYYQYPENEAAYSAKDQYMFGSELLVAPFIRPANDELGLSNVTIWLPEGKWFNIFTGQQYEGDRYLTFYGELEEYPVFAPAGAILPLDHNADWGSGITPSDNLDINIFAGQNHTFTLYEDDGQSYDYSHDEFSLTTFSQTCTEEKIILEIKPGSENRKFSPKSRTFNLHIFGINNSKVEFDHEFPGLTTTYNVELECMNIHGIQLLPHQSVRVSISNPDLYSAKDRRPENIRKLLRNAKINTWYKQGIDQNIEGLLTNPSLLNTVANQLTLTQIKAIQDIINYKNN